VFVVGPKQGTYMRLVDRMWNVLVLKLAVYTDSKHLDSKDLIFKQISTIMAAHFHSSEMHITVADNIN